MSFEDNSREQRYPVPRQLYLQDLNFTNMTILFGKTNINCKKSQVVQTAGKLRVNFTYKKSKEFARFWIFCTPRS